MRSPRSARIDKIRTRGSTATRIVDMTARVRVYRRDSKGVKPAELLPDVYGGLWDTWTSEYKGAGTPVELAVHPGQLRLLEAFDIPGRRRTLSLGSQGGGKTEGLVVCGILLALWHAGKYGGVVAPTRGRVRVIWRKFLKTIPARWIKTNGIRPGDQEIHLVNGSVIQFFAAKRQGRGTGSPLAGNDWYWAIEEEQQDIDDESLEEVDARGRVNPGYQVFSGATNEPYGHFQRRIAEYEANSSRGVVRFSGPDNAFVDPRHWENLKANWSADSYRRKILCEDVPIDGSVYPAFSLGENMRQIPADWVDITTEVTRDKYRGSGVPFLVGTDFGQRVTASVIARCFRPPAGHGFQRTDKVWAVTGEVITENRTTDWHAAALVAHPLFGGDASKFIAITGADSNSTDPDRSNFVLFKRRGIQIMRATYGKVLSVTHRYSMVNALLQAADGKRRLYVEQDKSGKAKAPKVVDSFQSLRLNASDRAETYGKGTKGGEDLTHYTDALGYLLFPFESLRGRAPSASTEET